MGRPGIWIRVIRMILSQMVVQKSKEFRRGPGPGKGVRCPTVPEDES